MANTTTCLLTTLKNTSGGTLYFGFLPGNGRSLAANGTVTVIGDVFDAITRGAKPASFCDELKDAIDDEQLEIVSTPSPILYDSQFSRSKMLTLNNNILYTKDPCWASTEYQSSV